MNDKFYRILTTIFFTLAALILLTTLLLVYTPLKDLFFKKPLSQIEETKITEPEEKTSEITTEKTKETTTEEKTTTEENIEQSEETTLETTEETSEEETGNVHIIDAKTQGYVQEIDYENRIITIKNEITGEIEKLDDFSDYLSIDQSGINESREFEDIKVGYYIFAMTEKEVHFDIFYEPTNKIISIWFLEEKPTWLKEEEEK